MKKKNSNNFEMRMKSYENCYRFYAPARTPLILRIDGCHFHSFTKGFSKPYDAALAESMQETMRKLCENIQGVKFGYTQSDEISLVLTDYDSLNTTPWFGKNIQKMCSVAASMATLFFNDAFRYYSRTPEHYNAIAHKTAIFDCRAFVIPKEEINNYFWWRQSDCIRNSISSYAQRFFSQRDLNSVSCDEMKQMLHEIGQDWEFMPDSYRKGVGCIKVSKNKIFTHPVFKTTETVEKKTWEIDNNVPIFHECPEYIKLLVEVKDD